MPGAAESSGPTNLPCELSSGASCLRLHTSSDKGLATSKGALFPHELSLC